MMNPSGSSLPDASKRMASPVSTVVAFSVNDATGGLFETVLVEVTVAVNPSSSVTVRVTM